MAPRDRAVSVGNVKPMSGNWAIPPGTEQPPGTEAPADQGYGWAADKYGTPTQPMAPTWPSIFPSFTLEDWEARARAEKAAQDALMNPITETARANSADLRGRAANQGTGSAFVNDLTSTQPVPGPTGPAGPAGPDFSAYRDALMSQAQDLNAQIQAMYNALGEEAGANVGRIQDIYGGASTGIGDVYGSAIGNVGDAYSSAQQQAADQLARLGIEEAAPAVVNPMALSQAEAISQLEQGQAGGQAAAERFGSAASGFGSQMAQVAQQQGTEMNAAILAALQNRLADSLLMEEQGRMSAGGGGSAQDALTAYQQAQLMAGAEGRGIDAAQWEYEQERRLQQNIVDTTFRLMEAEGLPFTEAQAQATAIVTGQAPATAAAGSSGGGFWDWLNTPLW